MKKIILGLLFVIFLFVFVSCKESESSTSSDDTQSESAILITSSDDAIQNVKKLLGTESNKYIFELSNEDKILKDENGDFYVNRDNKNSAKGLDCYVIRVFTEVKKGDSISQNNLGWYFVCKSNGKIFEMKDPYEIKLKSVN